MGQRADTLGSYDDPGSDPGSAGAEAPTYPAVAGTDLTRVGSNDSLGSGDTTSTSDITDTTQATASGAPDTEAIRTEIEQTRAEMSQTIDAIQEQLTPQAIVEQVKDTVKDTAAGLVDQAKDSVREATVGRVEQMVSNASDTARATGSDLVDTVRNNPIPAALIGVGLGWLFLNRNDGGAGRGPAPVYRDRRRDSSPAGYRYGPTNQGRANVSYRPASYTASGAPGANNGGLLGTIKANPVPAAIAAASLGWLLTRGGGGTSAGQVDWQRSLYQDQSWGGRGPLEEAGSRLSDVAGQAGDKAGDVAQAAGDVANAAGDKVSQAAGAAGDKVSQAAGAAADTVGQVASAAGDLVGQAGDRVGEVAGHAGETVASVADSVQTGAQQAQTRFQQALAENPLAVGAVALALGAAVGMALPQTEPEHRLLGPARDNLVEKAQEVAQQTVDKVQQVTEDVQQTAQQSAQEQGLTV